ncbi:NADH-quinone oxidoreductase subunit C [Photobacterium marinum]|nr:NADH-quinone oxidoreductase subunit C [Photobacterium marinum]
MIDKVNQLKEMLAYSLQGLYSLDIHVNAQGVHSMWCKLDDACDIQATASTVKKLGGRLSTITAYQLKSQLPSVDHEIAYHFDINGATLTATVQLIGSNNKIMSLTPIFRNADWNEREFMELYDITVIGHPNPRRLFIDESIDSAVLQRYIPYSAMVNAASTKTLWENIMRDRGED